MGFPIFKTGSPLVVPPYSPITTVLSGEAGGLSGSGEEEEGPSYLTLPVGHNWIDENYTTSNSGTFMRSIDGPAVYGSDPVGYGVLTGGGTGSWNRAIQMNPDGGSYSMEALFLDLQGTIDPSLDDIRVVLLAKTVGTAQSFMTAKLLDNRGYPSANGNQIGWHYQENYSPDYHSFYRTDAGEYAITSEDQNGGNLNTGNDWRYYMFYYKPSTGAVQINVKTTGGSTLKSYGWTVDVATGLPAGMRYVRLRGVHGAPCEFAQVWVGSGAWPSFPMTPLANLVAETPPQLTGPVTIDFEEETIGVKPSFVHQRSNSYYAEDILVKAISDAGKGTPINGAGGESFTKALHLDIGASTAAQCSIDVGGVFADESSGWKVQLLCQNKPYGSNLDANIGINFAGSDWGAQMPGFDRIYAGLQEDYDPDKVVLNGRINIYTPDNEEQWNGSEAYSTHTEYMQDGWTYLRFYMDSDKQMAFAYYNLNGALTRPAKTFDASGLSRMPQNLRYVITNSASGFHHAYIAQIWVGRGSDDWPAFGWAGN